MAEVVNITNMRGGLLSAAAVVNKNGEIIITRDNKPVAALIGIEEYEHKFPGSASGHPALMVLGARECQRGKALESIRNINSVQLGHYSKVIFVYGDRTKKYRSNFKVADLRAVYNKKSGLPIITSLKCGIAALSESDKHFVVVFLSQPQDRKTLVLMSKAVTKGVAEIVVLKKRGFPVHPIAFSSKYKQLLLKTRKELGIPYIVKKFEKAIRYVDI